MNLDDLTLGQARELASMFPGINRAANVEPVDLLVGKYVICRCTSAGVHAGTLVRQVGDMVELRQSRRLWQWTARHGIALSGLAQHGLKSGKVDTENPFIRLTGVCETIMCSIEAKESINAA